jgi:hypothetical protein
MVFLRDDRLRKAYGGGAAHPDPGRNAEADAPG